jgi:hypothetical protein
MTDLLGWQQTRWGMSANDIVAAVGVEHLRQAERQTFQESYVDLVIPNVKIGKHDFTVYFQMANDTNKLIQVLIRHEGELHQEPRDAYDVARKMLTERFEQPNRSGTSEVLIWTFLTTVIELTITFSENILSLVAIIFKPAETPEKFLTPSAF